METRTLKELLSSGNAVVAPSIRELIESNGSPTFSDVLRYHLSNFLSSRRTNELPSPVINYLSQLRILLDLGKISEEDAKEILAGRRSIGVVSKKNAPEAENWKGLYVTLKKREAYLDIIQDWEPKP